jgi:hypothetical protein
LPRERQTDGGRAAGGVTHTLQPREPEYHRNRPGKAEKTRFANDRCPSDEGAPAPHSDQGCGSVKKGRVKRWADGVPMTDFRGSWETAVGVKPLSHLQRH